MAKGPTPLVHNFVTGNSESQVYATYVLNATASARTLTLDLNQNYRTLYLAVAHTNSAATTVTMAVTVSLDGTNYFTRQRESTGTLTDFPTLSNAVSGDEDFLVELDVAGLKSINIVFSGASAGAGDTVAITATAVS